MMSDFISFDFTRLEGIRAAPSDLSRLEDSFRSHQALNSELPVIFEDEVLKDEIDHGYYFSVCFDYIVAMKKILQVVAWLYEDELASQNALNEGSQSLFQPILSSPNADEGAQKTTEASSFTATAVPAL